jgi:hypothetical protein
VGASAPAIHLLVSVNWTVEVHGPRVPGVVVIEEEFGPWGHGGHGHWGGHGRW